jgi:hypothetical protein
MFVARRSALASAAAAEIACCEGRTLPFDRAWIATVLTLQTVGGAILGIAAQAVLVVVIFGYVMPFFGLELLDMARDVATFNLPMRVGQLFGVSL